MGSPKALIHWRNEPWIFQALRAYQKAGGKRAVIVLGHQAEKFWQALPEFQSAVENWQTWESLEVAIVVNLTPELGQFSSIQCGLRWLTEQPNVSGVFLLPVDVPAAKPDVWQKLSVPNDTVSVCVPCFGDKGGHPVRLSKRFSQQLLKIDPRNERGRLDLQISGLSQSEVVRIEVEDSRIRLNLNTPQKFQAFVQLG